jgi:hypothetical protein
MVESLKDFGQRIRRRREELNLTLDSLAAQTGISKPYLSNIETARIANPPSDAKLTLIATALGFTQGELLLWANWLRTPASVRLSLHGQTVAPIPHTSAPAALPAGLNLPPGAVCVTLADDAMAPDYYAGDVVIAVPVDDNDPLPELILLEYHTGSWQLGLLSPRGGDEFELRFASPLRAPERIRDDALKALYQPLYKLTDLRRAAPTSARRGFALEND